MKQTIKDREHNFIKLCEEFIPKYGIKLVKEFVNYWTETNLNGNKMRFEKEKTFGLSRRLSTWSKNSEKWDTPKKESGSIMQQIFNNE